MLNLQDIATLAMIGADKLREQLSYRRRKRTMAKQLENIRAKEKIRALFILNDLAKWKTEILYKRMLSHPRFEPIICATLNMSGNMTLEAQIEKYLQLTSYLEDRGYAFVKDTGLGKVDCDIIFYQEPYVKTYTEGFNPVYNNKIICYTLYCFINEVVPEILKAPIITNSTFFFVENEIIKKVVSPLMQTKGKNVRVTGIPFMDSLMAPAAQYDDPWRNQGRKKKRIIWAPHYSTPYSESWLKYSRFLDMYEFMPQLAEKYKDDIQIAFKPHPLLYPHLEKIWGGEKAAEYYQRWKTMDNTQVEDGEYMGLFKHSDAMIHDCASFAMEYIYIDKPIMCCIDPQEASRTMQESSLMAYGCAVHGYTEVEVEQFIQDVITGRDTMADKRHDVLNTYLLPPEGKSACENIINEILGR